MPYTEMREEGRAADREWLDKNVWMIRKKKRLFKQETTEMIEWEPSAYTFDWNGRQTTVQEYFKDYYGIELKYPNVRRWSHHRRVNSAPSF